MRRLNDVLRISSCKHEGTKFSVESKELIILMDKANDYDSIISKVHELFEVDKVKFDIQWRDKFMNTIIYYR